MLRTTFTHLWTRISTLVALSAAAILTGRAAFAAEPTPGGLWHQTPASPKMEAIEDFHALLVWVITGITLFVLALLLWVMVRYNAKANPVPSKTTHHVGVEVVWTIVPVLILAGLAVPSFGLLYQFDKAETADMTIKAIGKQWFWTYEYPDHGNFTFDSLMIENPTPEQGPRLLAVDNRVVVPVNATVRVIVTASDVIHAFALPAFGNKMDAIPGRLNETWFRATAEGVYYGQCSELCGSRHAFMPIAIEVVSQERFNAWVADAQVRFARVAQPSDYAALAPAGASAASEPAAQ